MSTAQGPLSVRTGSGSGVNVQGRTGDAPADQGLRNTLAVMNPTVERAMLRRVIGWPTAQSVTSMGYPASGTTDGLRRDKV